MAATVTVCDFESVSRLMVNSRVTVLAEAVGNLDRIREPFGCTNA